MDLSSDLPCGVRAVREFITGGQSLSMNVLREADRGFRFDLKEGRSQAVGKVRRRTPAGLLSSATRKARQGRMMAGEESPSSTACPKSPLVARAHRRYRPSK